jgi:hypothetical protein
MVEPRMKKSQTGIPGLAIELKAQMDVAYVAPEGVGIGPTRTSAEIIASRVHVESKFRDAGEQFLPHLWPEFRPG